MIQPPRPHGGNHRDRCSPSAATTLRLHSATAEPTQSAAGFLTAIHGCLADYFRGRLPTWVVAGVLLPLAIASLLVGAACSFRHYPADKPFKKYLVSHMASRKHNPEGYCYLATGLLATGILLAPFPDWLYRHANQDRRRSAVGWWLMTMGVGGTTLVGFESALWPGIAGWHELAHSIYAACGFAGIWLGSLCLSSRARSTTADKPRQLSLLRIICAVPMISVVGAAVVVQAVPSLRYWSREVWPPELAFLRTFAFWQWCMVCAIMINLVMTVRKAARTAQRSGEVAAIELMSRIPAPMELRRAA